MMSLHKYIQEGLWKRFSVGTSIFKAYFIQDTWAVHHLFVVCAEPVTLALHDLLERRPSSVVVVFSALRSRPWRRSRWQRS